MSPHKIVKKKMGIKNIKTFIPTKINLDNLKVNPINAIDKAKNKFSSFYNNLKKDREKERKRLEKKRNQDEKKKVIKQKERRTKRKT